MLNQVARTIEPPLPLARLFSDWRTISGALAEPPRRRQPQLSAYFGWTELQEDHAAPNKLAPMGLYPALVVLGIYDRCTPKLASDASRAVAMLSSLAEAQAQLRSDGIALDIKTLRSTAYRYAARARAAQQSAACGLLDRVTGKRGGRLPRRGPRPCEAQEAWPQDEEGAQPIPYRLEGTEAPHPVRRRRRRATVSDVGPDHRRHAPGTGGGLRPAVVVRAADRPQRR